MFASAAIVAAITAGKASAQEVEKQERLDSAVVSASRAGKSTPVTYTMVGRQELRQSNPINSLPMTLALQPSVVVSHEGGTGIGYSKMTVRGSKGSQINVTLNGITLNDAESQEVFWVNIPALSSILSGVQVQRGLGTSANGAGAFGASINMNTAFVGGGPAFQADFSAGSYGTNMTAVRGATGLLPSGLYFDVFWSSNHTEGYVQNGWGDASSLLAVLGWLRGDNSLRLTYLRGEQRTGITWTGISLADMARDRTYNPEGLYYDADGTLRRYRNHTDNYLQQHLQLNWTHRFSEALTWITTLNYTDGYGYNERYKRNKKLSAYGFPSSFAYGGGVTAKTKGDVIFRKTMDNGYWVLNSEAKYRRGDKINLDDILVAISEEDVLAIRVVEEIGSTLGRGIAGLINVFNPEVVVIGGRLAVGGDYLMFPIRSAVKKLAQNLVSQDTSIKFSKLGADAAPLGDCMLSRGKLLGVV